MKTTKLQASRLFDSRVYTNRMVHVFFHYYQISPGGLLCTLDHMVKLWLSFSYGIFSAVF